MILDFKSEFYSSRLLTFSAIAAIELATFKTLPKVSAGPHAE